MNELHNTYIFYILIYISMTPTCIERQSSAQQRQSKALSPYPSTNLHKAPDKRPFSSQQTQHCCQNLKRPLSSHDHDCIGVRHYIPLVKTRPHPERKPQSALHNIGPRLIAIVPDGLERQYSVFHPNHRSGTSQN